MVQPDRRGGEPALTRPLVVVSNREPYIHSRSADGSVTWSPTTGGVSVALDALMRERGGVWIAHGAGDADKLAVDDDDRVRVPPDAPAYDLRRIWLTEAEEHHYYDGFANEGLWPLCHVAHVKPVFRTEDWRIYQSVNRRFAHTVHAELPDVAAPIFVQDYHLTLVPRFLRELRPGARVALFWHIPFPHPDQLRICPYRREILEGLADCDLLAFQLERDRRNFLAAARTELGATARGSRLKVGGRTMAVCAVPIGVDYDRIQAVTRAPAFEAEQNRLRRELRIDTALVGVGVDRLDYTKGIPERLSRPRRAVHAVAGAQPPVDVRADRGAVAVDARQLCGGRDRHRPSGWRPSTPSTPARTASGPIRYRKSALRLRRLAALYRLADFCIVSSLHDGMNLVAKEFVAAREDLGGVLVLSELAGAAQELTEAVIINPYDVEGFADGLQLALDMQHDERQRRMRALRRVVAGRDVFRWATEILEELDNLDHPLAAPRPRAAPGQTLTAPVGLVPARQRARARIALADGPRTFGPTRRVPVPRGGCAGADWSRRNAYRDGREVPYARRRDGRGAGRRARSGVVVLGLRVHLGRPLHDHGQAEEHDEGGRGQPQAGARGPCWGRPRGPRCPPRRWRGPAR